MSSSVQSLKLIGNNEFEIVKIDEQLYDETVKLYRNYFLKYENFAICCNLSHSEQTLNEMETCIRSILNENISFAARHIKTKQMAALCINTLEAPKDNEHADDVFDSQNIQTIAAIISSIKNKYDICKEWQINCVVELIFLSTKTEFARKGLALSLAEYTIEYLRHTQINTGSINRKVEAIVSIFTSHYSQKIGKKLGFQTFIKVPFTELSFEGVKFSEKIDPIHKYVTYAGLKL